MTEMIETDRDALTRALALARAESESERERFDREEAESGWQWAAESAAYACQCATLRLKVWQAPPMHAGDVVTDAPCYGHRPEEVGLRRRMLALGISVFEPDPIAAVQAAEANRTAAVAK
jgi:hypothetical protein